MSADVLTIKAGISALEGRSSEALATYREALRAWQALGLVWDEALCAIDMATTLDAREPEVSAIVDRARETLTALGAMPMLTRLEATMSSRSTPEGASLASAK